MGPSTPRYRIESRQRIPCYESVALHPIARIGKGADSLVSTGASGLLVAAQPRPYRSSARPPLWRGLRERGVRRQVSRSAPADRPLSRPPTRASATHIANDFNTLPPASVILLPTPSNRAILSRFVRRGRVARPGRGNSDELDELDGVFVRRPSEVGQSCGIGLVRGSGPLVTTRSRSPRSLMILTSVKPAASNSSLTCGP